MRKSSTYRLVLAASAVLGAGLLSACNSSSTGNQIENTLGSASPPPQQSAGLPPIDEVQDPRAYCPKTVMRAGTETLDVYPADMRSDDPDAARKLRFRATITDVVRECNYAGEFLTMKVGVAGRVVSGPGGETGELLMPIRVAATQGQTVLYSKLHDVPVVLSPGRPNTRFSYVDAQVVIPKPERENIVVYVGYDEQRVDNPASVVRVDGSQQPEELQPVN